MKRELTCIVCPKGCLMTVETVDGKEIKVIGNTCKRGESYAISECTAPVRTLTTTAPVEGGGVTPVKTSAPIPKEKLFECMEIINRTVVPKSTPLGYVIIKNILDSGADVVTTRDNSRG